MAADGWPCWAFSNHDVVRHVSRWRSHAKNEQQLAKLAAALLLSMRGSVCLYEGEELGLHEAELAYEDLVDPYGLRLWPEYKGRDGCRTPMVWESGIAEGGFHNRPPVAAGRGSPSQPRRGQAAHGRYLHPRPLPPPAPLPARAPGLGQRRYHVPGKRVAAEPAETLAFIRRFEGSAILCVFNLSAEPAVFQTDGNLGLQAIDLPGLGGRIDGDRIILEGHEGFFGQVV